MSSSTNNSLASVEEDSSANESEVEESEEGLTARVFKSGKTRQKYQKFIGIQGIRKQPKSQSFKKRKVMDESDNSTEPETEGTSEIVHFKCLTCLKIFATPLSSTSNIARHLKVKLWSAQVKLSCFSRRYETLWRTLPCVPQDAKWNICEAFKALEPPEHVDELRRGI